MSLADRFWKYVQKSDGCWLWTGARSLKYGSFMRRTGTVTHAHRVAWELTYGPISDSRLYVCHQCDQPLCCRPTHLFLGTQADNMRDMVAKGRSSRGEKRNHKLTADQVREIRARYAAGGTSHMKLAAEYGVSYPTIGSIVIGKTWRHLPESPTYVKTKNPFSPGETHAMAKLTDNQVREIRARCCEYSLTDLAAQYGVSLATISLIVSGKTWRHLL